MKASELKSSEYATFYENYIKQAGDLDLLEGLSSNFESALPFYNSISEDQFNYRYAEDKWTIKEVLQHIIDAERLFAGRALRIARKDKINLPAFSQNAFAEVSNANNRSKAELIEDYKAVRSATLSLFKSFTDQMLKELGMASDVAVSTRAIGFIIIGHETHHIKIIKERYL